MSKQDGYSPRTAADLERKYNFGQTFAKVFNIAEDAQKIAQEAQNSYENLTQEQIFNLLTNYGQSQGIYRGEDGNVYVNASYINSGKLSGENLEVEAAIVKGELTAATINAGKITGGELDFDKVTAKNLTIGGGLPDNLATKSDILTKTSQLTNDKNFIVNDVADDYIDNVLVEYSKMTGITEIVGGVVTTEYIKTLGISASTLFSGGDETTDYVSINGGQIDFYSGSIRDGYSHASGRVLEIGGTEGICFVSGGRGPDGFFRFVLGDGSFYQFEYGDIVYYSKDSRVQYWFLNNHDI